MAIFWIEKPICGLALDRPAAGDPRLEATIEAPVLYIATDTGDVSLSNGQVWTPIGSVTSLGTAVPGFASDGSGGVTVAAQVAAANVVLSGPGGTTSTHVATQQSGQTGYLYQGIGADTLTKFAVGVDGEVVTQDDVIAIGIVKGNSGVVTNTGITASRPGSPTAGQSFFDTTLNLPVWYSGSGWVDATGASV